MNYLAHLYLSEGSEESLLGSIMADFVKGPLVDQYQPAILRAIGTHRKVDAYTDTHEVVLESRKLFSANRRRFAGIIIDVAFDHFLAKNWSSYSNIDLNDFIQKSYGVLYKYRRFLPGGLEFAVPRMIEEDWLGSYRKLDGIAIALDKISRRIERKFHRKSSLNGAIQEVKSNYKQLENNFKIFFPDLISYVGSLTSRQEVFFNYC